jgi:hypothetical protein
MENEKGFVTIIEVNKIYTILFTVHKYNTFYELWLLFKNVVNLFEIHQATCENCKSNTNNCEKLYVHKALKQSS